MERPIFSHQQISCIEHLHVLTLLIVTDSQTTAENNASWNKSVGTRARGHVGRGKSTDDRNQVLGVAARGVRRIAERPQRCYQWQKRKRDWAVKRPLPRRVPIKSAIGPIHHFRIELASQRSGEAGEAGGQPVRVKERRIARTRTKF